MFLEIPIFVIMIVFVILCLYVTVVSAIKSVEMPAFLKWYTKRRHKKYADEIDAVVAYFQKGISTVI